MDAKHPTDHPCPTCGAKQGEWCKVNGLRLQRPHPRRIKVHHKSLQEKK